ncbi:hypothetical protein OIU79_027286 [Salix purpurea]|uniref:Uncharacterized protein n=1 Tax=Salix purpurea TaxID=77065 RepID=A0A9Q0VTY0_SALPP|nr:hypothetical protein OIU79_027286 [Salix purpurea]
MRGQAFYTIAIRLTMASSSSLTRWPSLQLPPPSLFATGQPFSDGDFTFHLLNKRRVWCFSCCCDTSNNITAIYNYYPITFSQFHVTIYHQAVFQ